MSDLHTRIAELEAQLAALKADVASSAASVPSPASVPAQASTFEPATTERLVPDQVVAAAATSRRSLLRTVAVGAAAAGAGALATTRPAAAANANVLNDPAVVTEITYTGPTLTTQSAVSVGETVSPPPLPIFPAAVGGYGAGVKIPHGLHGSTTAAGGYGVVAANGAAPAAGTTVPAATAIATLGAHARLIGPQATATAAGVANPPATVGPTAGTYVGGELYMDDAFNLWFFVKDGTNVFPMHLAGPSVTGSFHSISPRPLRVLDTRTGTSPARVANGANPTVSLASALTGLAARARAVVLNLTVTDTVGSGFHTAYAAGLDLASIRNADGTIAFSNVNWDGPGQNRANLAVVPVGRAGGSNEPAISLIAGGGGSTHLVIDLVGYYL
jgi:hypothetical protein